MMAVLLVLLGLAGLGAIFASRIEEEIDAATPDPITGTQGDDSLTGIDGTNLLDGLAGNDTLTGGAALDIARGGLGDDLIAGGAGDDSLYGNEGADDLAGEAGDDFLDGGPDDDRLFGGDGKDTLEGERGFDTITGGAGEDLIRGGDNADKIAGGVGLDVILGGTGDDLVAGEDGNDLLQGDAGADTILGGAGNDVIDGYADPVIDDKFQTADLLDRDSLDGGPGDDRIILGSGDVARDSAGADSFATGLWVDPAQAPEIRAFDRSEDTMVILVPQGYAGPGTVTVETLETPLEDSALTQRVLLDGKAVALVDVAGPVLRASDVRIVAVENFV